MFTIAIFCCLAAAVFGGVPPDYSDSIIPKPDGAWWSCAYDCDYDTNGLGYIPHYNCRNFIQCQRVGPDQFIQFTRCCPDIHDIGVIQYWDQNQMTCTPKLITEYYDEDHNVFAECNAHGIDTTDCEEIETESVCRLREDKEEGYYPYYFWNGDYRIRCAPGTHWDQDNCTCVHGGPEWCDETLLVNYTFTAGPDEWIDSSCNLAPCHAHGDAQIFDDALLVDGAGYCEFSLLTNWMASNPESRAFTIQLRFKQTNVGYKTPVEGLYGNGDCKYEPTVALGTVFGDDHVADGHIFTDSGLDAVFAAGTIPSQYLDNVWVCVAMIYDGDHVTYYINGDPVPIGTLAGSGDIANTQVASTIGMSIILNSKLGCEPTFFHGLIDDVQIWKRVLDVNTELLVC